MNKKSKQALEEFVQWAREWIAAYPEFDLRKSQLLTGLAEGRACALDVGFLADRPNNILHWGPLDSPTP